MNKLLWRIAALIICIALVMPALCAGGAAAEEADILGKPFPDFTATDTEGNTFTLSEALKDHEAVLINLWASWCGPCEREFPDLTEVYGKYGDRVAFIALSVDPNDTLEAIEAYRKEKGVSFPMGRDEGQELGKYVSAAGIPVSVVVDRFGNAAFCQVGAFLNSNGVERVLEAFLGDGYTETVVLDGIPRDASTQAFPVSPVRTLYPEDGNYRKFLLYADVYPTPVNGYIVPDDSVRIRIEIEAGDDAYKMIYVDTLLGKYMEVASLLDPERGVFVYDQAIPGPEEGEQVVFIGMLDMEGDEAKEVDLLLIGGEEYLDSIVAEMTEQGYENVHWEYADAEEKTADELQAYTLYVVDQNGSPVEEVTVNFCTDISCTPKESDENGVITFDGEPDVYHVTIVDAPEGYSWDEEYEMYTTREYGEWVLCIRKD